MGNCELRVIDFFCGAGGFSEGFRQQNFQIVMGVDNWRPAVLTHNLNHDLNDDVMDILFFEGDTTRIDALPNTEVIIGSPPCVTFSMSNKAGKADKSLGIRLIEAYLRIVAVKKHQPGSILKAWLMENVPNSRNYVQETYSFTDLNLSAWAESVGLEPNKIALHVKDNGDLFTASDYGSPQSRTRFICGEIVATGKFPTPKKTHGKSQLLDELLPHLTLGDIKSKMPSPQDGKNNSTWTDPNYPTLAIEREQLTDHFYDTGVYEVEWRNAKEAKINHPFMGKMSFPEDEARPSRTIMATRSASTREAIIFRSELERKGDGQYRLPTIREAATLMGFPYNYQFTGGEGTKWRLIGNAVCPHMSAALAKAILKELGKKIVEDDKVEFRTFELGVLSSIDLATQAKSELTSPPKKKPGASFRAHPFKSGNMTVALTNFDPAVGSNVETNGLIWFASIFVGSGKEYKAVVLDDQSIPELERVVKDTQVGETFLGDLHARFAGKIASASTLQAVYTKNVTNEGDLLSPGKLVEEVRTLIDTLGLKGKSVERLVLPTFTKINVPLEQVFAMLAMIHIVRSIKTNE